MLTEERNDLMKAQGNLDVLPALTGGRTILNNNEPDRMVPAVLHESDVFKSKICLDGRQRDGLFEFLAGGQLNRDPSFVCRVRELRL